MLQIKNNNNNKKLQLEHQINHIIDPNDIKKSRFKPGTVNMRSNRSFQTSS